MMHCPTARNTRHFNEQIDELNKVLEPYGIKAPDIAKNNADSSEFH